MTRRRRPSAKLDGSGRGFGSTAPVVVVAGGERPGLEDITCGIGGSEVTTVLAAEAAALLVALPRRANGGGMELIVVGGRIAGC